MKKTTEPFDAAQPLTADTKRPIPSFFWSRDSKYILFVQDKAGDENFNVYAVNPADAPAAGQDVPAARNLTDAKGARAIIYAVPQDDPDVDLRRPERSRRGLARPLQSEDLDRRAHAAAQEHRADRRLGLRPRRQAAAGARTADNGDTEILQVDDDGFKKVYSCNVFETCGPCGSTRTTRASTWRPTRATSI